MKDTASDNKIDQASVRFYSFVFAIVLGVVIGVMFYCDAFSSDSTEVTQSLTVTINPNTAEIASLVRLPGIGPSRARDIVEYRSLPDVDKPAFKSARDMENIKGIGPKTADKIAEYLRFD